MSTSMRRLASAKCVIGLVVLLVSSGVLLTPVACEDLTEGQHEGTKMTTATVVAQGDGADEVVPASSPAASTLTTTGPPGTSTTLGLEQIDPGLIRIDPGAVTLDPNLLMTPTRYEDAHPSLRWGPAAAWTTQSGIIYSGGTQKTSTMGKMGWVSIGFEGTGVRLISSKGPNGGRIMVFLHGVSLTIEETIDLHSAGVLNQQEVWYSGPLYPGAYSFNVKLDSTNAPGVVLWVDAFDVWGTAMSP